MERYVYDERIIWYTSAEVIETGDFELSEEQQKKAQAILKAAFEAKKNPIITGLELLEPSKPD